MNADEFKVLHGIAQSLRHIEVLLAAPAGPSSAPAAPQAEVASERDLRGQYGDPEVRADPRDWSGPSQKGRRLSECPADFLDMYAEMKDYFARKAEEEGRVTAKGKPASFYERLDASRARGWAKLMRDGKHTPPAPVAADDTWATADAPDDSDIPFAWFVPLLLATAHALMSAASRV